MERSGLIWGKSGLIWGKSGLIKEKLGQNGKIRSYMRKDGPKQESYDLYTRKT